MTKNQQLVRYMTNVFIVRFTQRWKKLMTLSKMNCPSLARACPPFVSMSIILPIIDLPPLKAERHNIIVQSKNNQQENNFFVIWSSYATFAFQYINTLYIFYHIAYVCIVFKGLMPTRLLRPWDFPGCWGSSKKAKNRTAVYDSAIPLVGIYLEKMQTRKDICIPMCICIPMIICIPMFISHADVMCI